MFLATLLIQHGLEIILKDIYARYTTSSLKLGHEDDQYECKQLSLSSPLTVRESLGNYTKFADDF